MRTGLGEAVAAGDGCGPAVSVELAVAVARAVDVTVDVAVDVALGVALRAGGAEPEPPHAAAKIASIATRMRIPKTYASRRVLVKTM